MAQAPVDAEPAVRLTEHVAQEGLHVVLQLCAAGRLRCSEKTRRPSAATVTAVAEVLPDGDFYPNEAIAAFAWPLLLHAGGLAEQAGPRLQLTARGRAALSASTAATIRHLWRRWVSNGLIDELSRVDAIKGQRAANVLTAVKPRRQAVADALATCPPAEWVTVDALFARMRRDLSIARSERGLWKLYIADAEYGSLGYLGFHDWPSLEGRYALAVLFEYAATLGLIDVLYVDPVGARDDFRDNWGTDDLDYLSRYDGLQALRLNALGAYTLGLCAGYEGAAAAQRTLKVLPNLDIVATGEITPADRLVLDAVAQRTADRVWSLTAATLLAALDAGRTPEEFSRFLESRALTDLPATVTTLIDDVTGRVGRLRDLGMARLVECGDATLITLITRDRKLRDLCHPVGDRHLAVPAEHDGAFRKALRTLGYALG